LGILNVDIIASFEQGVSMNKSIEYLKRQEIKILNRKLKLLARQMKARELIEDELAIVRGLLSTNGSDSKAHAQSSVDSPVLEDFEQMSNAFYDSIL
jgi:hypothetical protein